MPEGQLHHSASFVATEPVGSEITHRVSVVVPVYQGGHTLEPLVAEIAPLTNEQRSPSGHPYCVVEVILVHDGAIDNSDVVMESLAKHYSFVKLIWLSRNFGQHPAILAGMASTTAEWVVTMDEDGQHSSRDIGALLDTALSSDVRLVYAQPINPPPHGCLRNSLSNLAKWFLVHALGNKHLGRFHSFRLIDGEIARSLAAYCGNNVFLDVALAWVVPKAAHCPLEMRNRSHRRSGYSFRKLARHFVRLVLTTGTRPLRLITILGMLSIVVAMTISAYALWGKITMQIPVQGWTSMIILMSFFSGCILFSLGIIAEYIAVALNISMGRPLYLVTSKPAHRKSSHLL